MSGQAPADPGYWDWNCQVYRVLRDRNRRRRAIADNVAPEIPPKSDDPVPVRDD